VSASLEHLASRFKGLTLGCEGSSSSRDLVREALGLM
jgi:hypothetical protein